MESYLRGIILSLLFLVLGVLSTEDSEVDLIEDSEVNSKRPAFQPGLWRPARATFYGDIDGSGTYDGGCGYGDVHKLGKGYGPVNAAISTQLYEKGATCGACYELKCEDTSKGCKSSANPITVTATNECPDSGWCAPPQEHFDLSQPAFGQLAEYKTGVISLKYRRVPCIRSGGMRFTISPKSNAFFLLVMVSNVAGAGDVRGVMIKGDKGKPFSEMKRNWGQYWEIHESLVGQSITFRVRASDGRKVTSWRVVPKDWKFGQTFEGKNFR